MANLLIDPHLAAMSRANPDVLIIGAGAAGISAGRTCAARGLSCLILEAGPEIGGRAVTRMLGGAPFDMGATWLHDAGTNPLTAFAPDALDHDTVRERHFWMGDRWATPIEIRDHHLAEHAFFDALDAAADGADRPVGDVAPKGGLWDATVRHWQGAQIQAREVELLSLHDQIENDLEGPNLLPRQGVGGLLAPLARGLPIRLDTAVESLDWSGAHVVARGGFGVVRAGAAIVTVSTGVLAAGGIAFTPALPAGHAQAIHDLPMGLLTKFGFCCPGRLGIEPFHGIRTLVTAQNPRPMSWVMWPFGADHCFGFVGGARAWELSAGGRAAGEAAARAEFAQIFGAGHLGEAIISDWGENPRFLGSYSQARPGAASARSVLAEPLGRLRFAGEATHHGLAGTIAGAWLEGERAAKTLLDNPAAA